MVRGFFFNRDQAIEVAKQIAEKIGVSMCVVDTDSEEIIYSV